MEKDVPRKYRKLHEEARTTTSRKKAIRFFCLECCGFDAAEVRQCTAKDCVMYKYRLKG